MGKKKNNLGTFQREAAKRGLTYAEAQMQESMEKMGRIRAPRGDDRDEVPYMKVSAREKLRKNQNR